MAGCVERRVCRRSLAPRGAPSVFGDRCLIEARADVGCDGSNKETRSRARGAVFVFPVDAGAPSTPPGPWGPCHQAQLHEKKQAQELYGDALAGGQSSFLLQQEGTGGDVFSCSLGNLPPGEEAALTLQYVCELPLEPDGAARYMLPAVLHPHYTPQGWDGEDVTQGVPRVPQGELPYTLSLSATLQSPHGIDRVLSNCSLTPLSYPAGNRTTAQVSLAEAPPWGRDVELLVFYAEPHKPSAVLEAGLPGVEPGSLMGDLAVMVTRLPSLPRRVPGQSSAGEFYFLLDRFGSMQCPVTAGLLASAHRQRQGRAWHTANRPMASPCQRVPAAPELTCGHRDYLGAATSHLPQPCRDGHRAPGWSLAEQLMGLWGVGARSENGDTRCMRLVVLFVFTDGEVENTDDVIAEVQRHQGAHRCFSFGIGEGASTALVKGIARAAGGSAEFITGQDRMQPKVLQSLKRALQPAVTQISLCWDLPPGMEVALLGRGPEVIFPGKRCLIYAQLRGQPQPPDTAVGGVTLQYRIQDQTYKETLQFPLQPQDGDRLPIHRLAAKSLLLELEGAVDTRSEGDRRRALETSLSSGVICSLTAYVGMDTEWTQPVQGPLVRRDIPLPGFDLMSGHLQYNAPYTFPAVIRLDRGNQGPSRMVVVEHSNRCYKQHPPPKCLSWLYRLSELIWGSSRREGSKSCKHGTPPETAPQEEGAPEESPLLRLVSLQNADGSWDLDSRLAASLGVSETDARGRMPSKDVPPSVWATVLAVVWLHGRAAGQRDEWELLEAKAVGWVRDQAGARLSECLEAANTLLGCTVGPAIFRL
nr:von Willebrand factor A domain-containing protein 5A-like [Chelonoidis abingdonii]